jgi:RNA polymerase sigma-70 factor (ECF subfamily)
MHPVRSSPSSAASQLAPPQSAEPLLVATVEPEAPLQAETPLEREVEEFFNPLIATATTHAERFLSYDAAQDAVQAAMVELWFKWSEMLPEERTPAWFLAAVHHRIVDELRRRGRNVALTEEVEEEPDFPRVISVAEVTVKKDLERWVDGMIDGMPRMRRHVYVLVRELGFSYKEAAETLGISVASVHTHLQKTRAYFLKGLEHADVELTSQTIMKLLPPKAGTSNE